MRVWLNRYVYGILVFVAGVVGLYIALNRLPGSMETSLAATGLLDKSVGSMIGREFSLLTGIVLVNVSMMLFFLGFGCRWIVVGIHRLLVDVAYDEDLGEWADAGRKPDGDKSSNDE